MNELITKFEAYLLTEKRVAKNTFAAYKRDIEQFSEFLAHHRLKLEKTNLDELKEFLHELKLGGLSARSMARKISSLKLLYAYLHEHHKIENIAKELGTPKLEKKLPQYLSETEVETLLKACDADASEVGIRNKVMIYLLYVSGMRISELVNSKLEDISFDTGFLKVRGKGSKERMVPLPPAMLALLKVYIESTRAGLLRPAKGLSSNYLFPNVYGGKAKPLSRQAFWVILKKIARLSGISRAISPHKLRHSLATHLLKKGADLRSLQMLLGHEQLSTVQLYTHLEPGYLRKIYDDNHPRS